MARLIYHVRHVIRACMHAVGNQQEQGDTGICGIVTHILLIYMLNSNLANSLLDLIKKLDNIL